MTEVIDVDCAAAARSPGRRRGRGLLRTLALTLLAAAARAQTLPLDDKARFERSLEDKTESVLEQMLGPGQAKVVVDAAIDFTRTEKVDLRGAAQLPRSAAGGSRFLWDSMRADEASRPQILPGFAVPQNEAAPAVAAGDNEKYEREVRFPEAFLKRLEATLILNQSIPEAQAQSVRGVVAGILGLHPERGDVLTVVRAAFPPPWKAALYSRDTSGALVKYAAFTLLSLLAIAVMAACFFKLAEAVSAMAQVQTHQVQLEIPRPGGSMGPAMAQDSPAQAALALEHAGEAPKEEAPPDDITFDVRPDQAGLLAEMIGREDASNIALVVSHLPAATRQAFLAKLPPEAAADIMEVLSHVKFVDVDTIARLKEELERRLKGAVGGADQVLSMLDGLDLQTKKEMLQRLSARSPGLAQEVRKTLLFMDDLLLLGDGDTETLAAAFSLEQWAMVLSDAPAGLSDKIRAAVPERSWVIIQQTQAARHPGPEKVRQAQETLLSSTLRLIRDGVLPDPRSAAPTLGGPKTAAAPPEAPAA